MPIPTIFACFPIKQICYEALNYISIHHEVFHIPQNPRATVALCNYNGEPIPAPSALNAIQADENERVLLVDVYMPSIRMAKVNRSVNRTVTLPAWLNAAALERNINFSQVLQDALKRNLGLA